MFAKTHKTNIASLQGNETESFLKWDKTVFPIRAEHTITHIVWNQNTQNITENKNWKVGR